MSTLRLGKHDKKQVVFILAPLGEGLWRSATTTRRLVIAPKPVAVTV